MRGEHGVRQGSDFDAEPLAPNTYDLPELPWENIAGRLVDGEDLTPST
jgi:hypothetical protein